MTEWYSPSNYSVTGVKNFSTPNDVYEPELKGKDVERSVLTEIFVTGPVEILFHHVDSDWTPTPDVDSGYCRAAILAENLTVHPDAGDFNSAYEWVEGVFVKGDHAYVMYKHRFSSTQFRVWFIEPNND